MTSKEALEKISWRYVNDPSFQEWCNIIKQDLERLEKENEYLKNANEEYQQGNYELSMAYAKLKQAKDILKDKLGLYLVEETFEKETIYALMSKVLGICISNHTKEEYELLKEVKDND